MVEIDIEDRHAVGPVIEERSPPLRALPKRVFWRSPDLLSGMKEAHVEDEQR
jgi:hypothetical protein